MVLFLDVVRWAVIRRVGTEEGVVERREARMGSRVWTEGRRE